MASIVLPTQEQAIAARASALLPILQACLQLLAAVQCPVRGTQEALSNLSCPLHGAIPHLSRLRCRIASSWKPSLLSTRPLPTDCLPWETGRFRKDGPKSPAWHRAGSWGTFHEWTKWNPETKTEEEKAECRLPRLCTRHKPAARRGGQDSRLPEKQGECFFLFLPPPDTLPFRTNPEPWSHTSSQMVHWGPRHRPRARTAGNARLREDHVASEGPSREDRRVRLPAGAVGPVPRPSLGVRGGICQSVWCHGRGAVRMFCLSEIFLTHGSPTRSCPHIVTAPRGPLQGVMRRCRDPLAFRLPAAAGSCQVSPGLAAPRRGRAAAHRYHCSPPRAVVNAGVSARHPSGASLSSRAESIQAT